MLDFGFSEILLTSAIALVVLGPERLPKVARQVGNWMGRARVMARQLTEQLEREVSADELLKEQSKPKPAANRIASPSAPLPYVPPPLPAPSVPAQAEHEAGLNPQAAPHAEYNPPSTGPTSNPSND